MTLKDNYIIINKLNRFSQENDKKEKKKDFNMFCLHCKYKKVTSLGPSDCFRIGFQSISNHRQL